MAQNTAAKIFDQVLQKVSCNTNFNFLLIKSGIQFSILVLNDPKPKAIQFAVV